MTARRWCLSLALSLVLGAAVSGPAAAQDAPPNLAELLPDLDPPRDHAAAAGHGGLVARRALQPDRRRGPRQSGRRHRPQLQHPDVDAALDFSARFASGWLYLHVRRHTRHVQAHDAQLRPRVRRARGDDGPEPVQRGLFVSAHGLPELRRPESQRRFDQVLPSPRGMLLVGHGRRHGGRWRRQRWRRRARRHAE